MKESFWITLIIMLGVVCVAFINFFQIYTNTDEQNYMLLKEVTEAAMYDSIDMNAYKIHGQLAINREKFVENFVRRFSESVSINNVYVIKIYDVNETPPKVTLEVSSKLKTRKKGELISFDIVNKVNGILEKTN